MRKNRRGRMEEERWRRKDGGGKKDGGGTNVEGDIFGKFNFLYHIPILNVFYRAGVSSLVLLF